MIDLPQLAEKLQGAGLLQKSFFNCTKSEIELICNSVLSSVDCSIVPATGWDAPYIDDYGKLQISFNSHPKYHWWQINGQSIYDTLIELNAPWEVAKKYLYNKVFTEEIYLQKLMPF